VRRNNLIAFHHIAELPTRQDIGDGAVFLDAANFDLGDQTAIAVDQQFAMFQHALFLADVNDDEVPLGIGDEHLASEVRRKRHDVLGGLVNGELVVEFLDFAAENFVRMEMISPGLTPVTA
jgi:hypothetical protein